MFFECLYPGGISLPTSTSYFLSPYVVRRLELVLHAVYLDAWATFSLEGALPPVLRTRTVEIVM